LGLGVVDEIIPEPEGGAHLDWDAAADILGTRLRASLAAVESQPPVERLDRRYRKFREMGCFAE